MARTKAIYAGSFDPPTLAHFDILEQAECLFDTTIVLGINTEKNPLLARDQREELFRAIGFEDIDVPGAGESIVDTAQRLNARVIVRGIRGIEDVGPEQAYLDFIEMSSGGGVTVVYFMSPSGLRTTSSALVRSVMALNNWYEKKLLGPYVSHSVIECLHKGRQVA
jgi:pantetheine-phosphate adenylyltransferase